MPELAECIPKPNGEFDPVDLVGWTFMVEIKMTSKNGREYPNIVDVALPEDDDQKETTMPGKGGAVSHPCPTNPMENGDKACKARRV